MTAVVASYFGMNTGTFPRLADDEPSVGSASPHASNRRSGTSGSNLGGVGIIFSKDKLGNFVVRTLQDGSCAAASGICPGDIIVSVDGSNTEGMSMRQVASAISGVAGSHVSLKIRRGTQAGNVTLERMPGFSKGVVGSDRTSASAAADSCASKDGQSAFSSSRTAESAAAATESTAAACVDAKYVAVTFHRDSDRNSAHAANSVATSLQPSQRDEEVIAISSSSDRAGKVSYFSDMATLPAAFASSKDGATRGADAHPTSLSIKRLSKDFERSHLFLELNDPKAVNAIVIPDCQHLIDSLAAPVAFDDARQRLIASRARLPMADMKKVVLFAGLLQFFACALSFPFQLQIAYMGSLKDSKRSPIFEDMCNRIPRNRAQQLPNQPLLRPRSMNVAAAYVSRVLFPSHLLSSSAELPPPPHHQSRRQALSPVLATTAPAHSPLPPHLRAQQKQVSIQHIAMRTSI